MNRKIRRKIMPERDEKIDRQAKRTIEVLTKLDEAKMEGDDNQE